MNRRYLLKKYRIKKKIAKEKTRMLLLRNIFLIIQIRKVDSIETTQTTGNDKSETVYGNAK